jgi:hypothetical protein
MMMMKEMMIKMMIMMVITIMMITILGIYSYIPETNHVSRVRNVEAHSVVTTYGISNVIFHDKRLVLYTTFRIVTIAATYT